MTVLASASALPLGSTPARMPIWIGFTMFQANEITPIAMRYPGELMVPDSAHRQVS